MTMAEQTQELTRRVDSDSTGTVLNNARPVSSVPARGDGSAASPARCALPPRPRGPQRGDGGTHRLPSGHRVWVRPLRTDDGPALAAAFGRLSARSRYRRFHTALPRLTKNMITYLTEIDHHDHEALVAFAPGPGKVIVGVARFIRDPAQPGTAELAVVVADSWQHRGLATLLLYRLARRAREENIHCLTGYILTENSPTISLLRALGPSHMECEGSTVTARMDLAVWAVDDPVRGSDDAVSYRRAPAAVEVALVSLAHLVPVLVHVVVAAIVEVITLFRAHRGAIRGHHVFPGWCDTPGNGPPRGRWHRQDRPDCSPRIAWCARPGFCSFLGVPRDRSASRSDQGRRPPHLHNNRP